MTSRATCFVAIFALAVAFAPAADLDTTTFVVLGDGLAAGMSGVGLYERLQSKNFAAQLARQMKTSLPQANFQAPGPGDIPGEPPLPAFFPGYPQTTVRKPMPPTIFIFNLSVPGLRLADALARKPALPLLRKNDSLQTLINMTLGFPGLIMDADVPLWTQVDYAVTMNPTMAMVELGYFDAIDAAVSADPTRMAEVSAFRSNYGEVVRRLRATFAEVVVTTIPDPTTTAYFSTIPDAAATLQRSASFLQDNYRLAPGDLLSISAIRDISTQLLLDQVAPLRPGRILKASDAARISDRVRAWNTEITAVARAEGAVVYDLSAMFTRLRSQGISVAGRTITGTSFGGFYSLDGFHPGATGHALIANEILDLLNRTYQTKFAPLDATSIAKDDPVFQYRPVGSR